MTEKPTDAGSSFWSFAAQAPERTALIDPAGGSWSAGELLAASNRLVFGLRGLGLERGDVVASLLSNRAELVALYLATAQAGLQLAPINTRLTAPETAHILADSGAKVLLHQASTADRAAGFGGARWDVDGEAYARWLAAQPAETPPDRTAGEVMIYTGGTTGLPKAVRRPISGLSPEARAQSARFHLGYVAGIEPNSGLVHLVTSPLHHSASLLWCTDQLQLGHTVVLMEKWDAEATLARIERHRVTTALMVPTQLHRLLALPPEVRARYDHSSLRHVVHGGAPCPLEIKRRMIEWWGPVIFEVYGAAEGGGTRATSEEWLQKPGTVGRGVGVQVLREDGSACRPGEVGVVHCKLQRPFEYHNDPDKTSAGRRGDLFTVGDLGYLDHDGYLFLCGRLSDLIISGGVNIYPAEIEAALLEHPAVADVAVFGVPDPEWGERVTALVVLEAGQAAGEDTADRLADHCRGRLAGYKLPRRIAFVPSLPRDAAGKLAKRNLRVP
jgi:long-chain acyl-CoA synthetase